MPTITFIDAFRKSVEVIEETNSFLRAVCPLCKGTSLKMNLSESHEYYGAYKCWSNNCPNEELRLALDLPKSTISNNDPFRPSNVFGKSSVFAPSKLLRSATTYYPDSFAGKEFLTLRNYVPTPKVKIVSGNSLFEKSMYQYSPYLRVLRIDKQGSEKKIYIQNWTPEDGWIPGTGDHIWPVFGMNQVLLSSNNYITSDSVVFVEGEKCAEYLRSKGCAAFTFMSGAFYGDLMFKSILVFRYFFPRISNIIFIKDCDQAGTLKETYVREGFSKQGLGYASLNLEDVFPDLELKDSKKDVVDLPWKPIREAIRGFQS